MKEGIEGGREKEIETEIEIERKVGGGGGIIQNKRGFCIMKRTKSK